MGPLGQLSPIGRAQTFVVNTSRLSKDNYSHKNLANRGRQLFLQTHITQLHKMSIFSFI